MSVLANMSQREKILAAGVGGIVFLLFNIFLLSFFFRTQASLRADLAVKQESLHNAQTLLAERELWNKRDAWLRAKQPKLTNESGAGVELLDAIKELAKKDEVALENPSLGMVQKAPNYRSVSVNLETKSSWPSLIKFLHDVQTPDQFIVFETANVQIDSSDQTKMRGRFKIARWFAP